MGMFPKIQSPCPYQGNLSPIMDGDMCRMCNRQVFDLTAMDNAGRVAFFDDCGSEVCVSYAVPIRSALGAAALAAALTAMPAAAQTQDVTVAAASAEVAAGDPDDAIIVIGGGIKPAKVEFTEVEDEPEDSNVPELPVIVEAPAALPAKRS